MYRANVFSIILIYNLISCTLIIDWDVLDYEYILSVLYKNNYKIFVILKLLLSYEIMHLQGKKFILIFILKKMTIRNLLFIRLMNLKILFITWN